MRSVTLAVGFAMVFLAGEWLGHALSAPASPFAMFWLLSGVYVAVLLRRPTSDWPSLVSAALVTNVGFEIFQGRAPVVALGFAMANTVEAVVAAGLFRYGRSATPRPLGVDLGNLRQFLEFVLVTCLVGAVIGAAIGAATVASATGEDPWATWVRWWIADSVGVLIPAPLLLISSEEWRRFRLDLNSRRLAELVIALVVFASVAIGIFWLLHAPGWRYVGLPLLLWITLRFRAPGTAIGLLILGAVGVAAMHQGLPAMASRLSPFWAIAELQMLLAVVSVCFLSLAAVVTDRERTAARLDELNRSLASEVARQTSSLTATVTRLELALQAAEMGTWQWTIGSKDAVVDARLRSILGLADGQPLSSRAAFSHIHPDDLERLRGSLEQWLKNGGLWEYEHRVVQADRTYWLAGRAAIVPEADGRRIATGVTFDVTRQREAEAALRESDERFRQLADHLDAGLWIYEVKTARNRYVSSGFQRAWGIDPAVLLADRQAWMSLVHPDDRARILDSFNAFLAGHPEHVVEYRIQLPDRGERWVHNRAFAVARDAAGDITVVVGFIIDTTERRATEQALRDADRQKDAFLAMLAHELRNPLAPIRTATQILGMSQLEEGARMEARAIIERQVAHIVRLVDDLLDVSRLSRGRLVIERTAVDLVALVRDTAHDYTRFLSDAGVTLETTLPSVPVWVEGDRTRLAQVLGNLLHNARKFTPVGGRVVVALRRDAEAGDAWIDVTDTGSGIDAELLPRVFEAFSQERQSLDRRAGGLGLGLSLVKGLVELHGGRVSAASGGAGQGTTVSLHLPLGSAEENAVRKADDAGPRSRRPLQIVVIEDNVDAAVTLRVLLELDGHTVRVAHTGREGISLVERATPDLVLCDIGLPGALTGLDVAEVLRAHVPRPWLVALSGYAGPSHEQAVEAAGFDRQLTKPVGPDELERLLNEVRTGSARGRERMLHGGIRPSDAD